MCMTGLATPLQTIVLLLIAVLTLLTNWRVGLGAILVYGMYLHSQESQPGHGAQAPSRMGGGGRSTGTRS